MIPYGLEESDFKILSLYEAYEALGVDEEAEKLWKMKDSEGRIIFYQHDLVPFMRGNKKLFRKRARLEAKSRLRDKIDAFMDDM